MDLQVYDQITNVANLPGIQKFAYCMSDGHSGELKGAHANSRSKILIPYFLSMSVF